MVEPPRAAIFDAGAKPGMTRWGCASDPAVFESALAGGWTTQRLGEKDLAAALVRERFDLLVVPCGAYFPTNATRVLVAFLKRGGALFTTGGYAFDSCDLVNTRRAPSIRDCLLVRDDQIGVFDPSHTLTRVAETTLDGACRGILPDVSIAGPLAGFSAVAMLGTNGHGFLPNRCSWQPVLRCSDAHGNLRGYAGALVRHTTGTFAGSNWAIFGVTDSDLFARGSEGARLIRPVADLLVQGLSLNRTTSKWPCYRRGETATFMTQVYNGARVKRSGRVRFRVTDEAGREAFASTVEFAVEPGKTADLAATWAVPEGAADYYALGTTLEADGKPLQREADGFVVWDEKTIARGPKITKEGLHLAVDGRPAFMMGAQTFWGQVGVTTARSPAKFLEDFRAMRRNGLTMARLFLRLSSEYDCRFADACVQLAQKCGIVFYHALNLGPTLAGKAGQENLRQAAEAARRFRDVPGYAVDLCNEPQATGPIAQKTMDDMRRWATECRKAILAERPGTLVSVGWMQRWGDGGKMFDPPYVSRDLDFTDNHYYGQRQWFVEETKEIDQRALGKPYVIGECGGKCHPTFLKEDPWCMGETENGFARRFAQFAVRTFGLGGSALLCWHWRDPMEGVFPCGLTRSDGVPRRASAMFARLAKTLGSIPLGENPPDVAIILSEAPRWTTNRMNYVRSARWVSHVLSYFGANWSMVTESDAAKLPASVKVRLVPEQLPKGEWPLRVAIGEALKKAGCRTTRRPEDAEKLETYLVPGRDGSRAWALVNDTDESIATERDGHALTLPPHAAGILSVAADGTLVRAEIFDGEDAEGVGAWRPAARWRGFNLLGMFVWNAKNTHPRYKEEDFRLISEWGFNFVRLPLDYRYWTHGGDWNAIDSDALKPLDEAVAFGRKHGVHVQICLHRAPGYCISRILEEPERLFESDNALAVCTRHWAYLARRYRDVPAEALSFNLMNEPAGVDAQKYAHVARALIDAIHAESPTRFIVSDGISGGGTPVGELAALPRVGQALRGYRPGTLTHYLASWAGCPKDTPRWPYDVNEPSGLLAGLGKKEMRVPLTIENCPKGRLTLGIDRVSGGVVLRVASDGKTLRDIALDPKVGSPVWKDAQIHPQWGNLCQATYAKSEDVEIPEGGKTLTLEVARGDWLNLKKLTLTSPDGQHTAVLPIIAEYSHPRNFSRRFAGWDATLPLPTTEKVAQRYPDSGCEYLYRTSLAPWDKIVSSGGFAMVGEFGCFSTVPHDIFIAWVEDNLRLWQERGWGWALWEFNGSFGVLDSGRKDVKYESYRGHQVDRQLLDLLQKY